MANSSGQGLFDVIAIHEERLRVLEDALLRDLDQLKKQIHELQGGLAEVKLDVNGYRDLRRRFCGFYKRDVEELAELQHTEAIRVGNAKAHAGDVLADATLWKHDKRRDHFCFAEIYGLRYDEVLEWKADASNTNLFLLLNAHGSLAANKLNMLVALRTAFRNLILRVQENWLQPPSEAEPGSPLRHAYDVFLMEYNADIERLRPAPWLRVHID